MASATEKQTLSLDAAEHRSGNLDLPRSTTQGSSFWARSPRAVPRSKRGGPSSCWSGMRDTGDVRSMVAKPRMREKEHTSEGFLARRTGRRRTPMRSKVPMIVSEQGYRDWAQPGANQQAGATQRGVHVGGNGNVWQRREPNGGRYRGRAAEKAHRTERGPAWTAASVKPRNAVVGRIAPRSKRGIRTIIIALGNVKNRNRSVWMGLIFRCLLFCSAHVLGTF